MPSLWLGSTGLSSGLSLYAGYAGLSGGGGLSPAGTSIVLLQGPVYDGFSGTGGISARATEAGGATWTMQRHTGTGDPFLVGSGIVVGGQGVNPNQGFGFITRSAAAMWVRRRINATAAMAAIGNTYSMADHITIGAGVANWMGVYHGVAAGTFSDITVRSVTAANVQTPFGTAINNATTRPGDSFTLRYAGLDGASPTITPYMNGQQIGGAAAINTTTNPITHQYGFRGATVTSVDDFMLANPATDRMIELIMPGPYVSPKAGNVVLTATFRAYPTMPAVGDLRYSWIDAATKLAITGHDTQPVSALQTNQTVGIYDTTESANVATCLIGTLTAAQIPAGGEFILRLHRLDVTAGSVAVSDGPIMRLSVTVLFTGQSLAQQMWAAAGTAGSVNPPTAATLPASFDATNQYGAADLGIVTGGNYPRVRTGGVSGTTQTGAAQLQFAGRVQLASGKRTFMGYGGWGGTLQIQRNLDATYHPRMLIGLANGNRSVDYVVDLGGQFEGNVPTTGGYYANFNEAINGNGTYVGYAAQIAIEHAKVEAMCGPTPRMLCPLNMVTSMTDADSQTLERLLTIEIPASNPTRYVRGPFLNACYRNRTQNDPDDVYHLSKTALSFGTAPVVTHPNSGYGMQASRIARRINFLMGNAATDENGPILVSATRVALTVLATFNPNGGTLAVRNTAYISDFRGGCDFATDAAFTNIIHPTNATVAGNVVTFTFASLSGAVYMRSSYGTRPFARQAATFALDIGSGGTGTNAVILDMPVRASMVCSDYAGNDFGGTVYWVEVQPSWNAGGSGVDYVIAA